MKKQHQKKLNIFFFGIFTLALLYFLAKPNATEEILLLEENPPATITIILAGDVMLDRGVELKIKESGGDWRWPFLEIAKELEKADLVFGNLEGPISDKGEKVGSIYSFRADPKAIEGLTFAGFDVLSVANNHMFDFGRVALEDTFLRLKTAGIEYAGGGTNKTEANSPVIKQVNGATIAFLAYTDLCPPSWKAGDDSSGINCISEKDLAEIKKEIETAKSVSDIVIVSLHSGAEYSQTITSFQTEFAHSAIDAGADLVVGHHPHVVQKQENYPSKISGQVGWIFYSLGNFVFDQDFSQETMQGQMVEILLEGKEIKKVTPIDITLNNSFQPQLTSETKTPPKITPLVSVSSEKLEQGDALLLKIQNIAGTQNVNGTLGQTKISFFRDISGGLIGILGIDAKKTPGIYKLTVNLQNGEKFEKNITVVKRNFPITVLAFTPELEEQGYTATSVQETSATNDGPKLYAAMEVSSQTAYFTKSFFYPLNKIVNVGAFGNIRKSGEVEMQHLGVDLDAKMNTPVYAVNDGKVTGVLELINYGNTIVIDHGLGIFSLYLHLDEFSVAKGQTIKRGSIIGYSGNTGYSIEPHLHFSMKSQGASVDPLRFIESSQKGMSY